MERIFIETPVSVGREAARIVILDAQGAVAAAFPIEGGAAEAVLHALAQDVRRRMNGVHEALSSAVRPLPAGWRYGVEAEREGMAVGRWWAALARP